MRLPIRPSGAAVITFGFSARHARPSSAAKAAVARLIGTDGSEEVNLAKCRPQHIRKVELTVHALPKKETGQADFATRSDDQVGIGQVRCIEMASYSLGCDTLDHIGQRCSFPRLQLDEATDSIGDLLPPSVPNCNRQCHQIVLRSRRLCRTNRRNGRLGKEVEATDRLYPDAFLMHEGIVSKRGDFGFDRRKDSRNLRLSSLEVLG